MIIGVARVTLALPGIATLKEKRALVRRLLERVRARFRVAAAEVDAQESNSCAVVGFSTVGAVGPKVQQALDGVVEAIEGFGIGHILNTELEVVRYDELQLDDSVLDAKFGIERDARPELAAEPHAGGGTQRRGAFRPGSLGLGSPKVGDSSEKLTPEVNEGEGS